MLDALKIFYNRYLTNPQAIFLIYLLLISSVVLFLAGNTLMPLFVAITIAYLLEGLVKKVSRLSISRHLSVWLVFIGFITFMAFITLGLLPIVMEQTSVFFQEMPTMLKRGQNLLSQVAEKYQFIPEDIYFTIINTITSWVSLLGKNVVSFSISSIPTIIIVLVYLFLVPLMVFFLMRDKIILLEHASTFLPVDKKDIKNIWRELDLQIGNYIRGKVYEILIIGSVTYLLFRIFGLNYAPLLASLVGLSVLIPYIGAAVVTVPIVLVAYFQWGFGSDFLWIILWYVAVQFLDGNILVPLLFSEAVNLHPIIIIVSVLFFGGLFGFWGVFFAIPLAILIKAILNSWPRAKA